MTIVFKLENNTANVRLKEKDSADIYLNDQILSKLWAKANTPVKLIPQPVEAPRSLKILTAR